MPLYNVIYGYIYANTNFYTFTGIYEEFLCELICKYECLYIYV